MSFAMLGPFRKSDALFRKLIDAGLSR